jgi:hypothetical protein
MKINKVPVIIVIGIVIAAIGIFLVILPDFFYGFNIAPTTIYVEKISLNSPTGVSNIVINAQMPESPAIVPIYRGYYDIGSHIEYTSPNWTKPKKSIPSVEEAPALAIKALDPYGGIPGNAIVSLVSQVTGKSIDPITLKLVPPEFPQATTVVFSQEINGMPFVGAGQGITVDLGENGELLYLSKNWRTLERTGDASIITAKKAVEKLRQGDVVEIFKDPVDITVTQIKLGYYENYPDRQETILEPVWIFYGTTSTGNRLTFFVDARESGSVLKFANFTANPTYGWKPLTVIFSDTSTSNVWSWYWDFGDGTISTEIDPVHTYLSNGQYTVSLRVADEIRTDTITKTSVILIGKKNIVLHTGTKLDYLLTTLNIMNIDMPARDKFAQIIEDAKAKNTYALNFIDQYKETRANDMLNEEDLIIREFMNEIEVQTGKAIWTGRTISTGDAAQLNSGATEILEFIQKAIETPL